MWWSSDRRILSRPGYKDVERPWVRFPIAEVNKKGEAIITK